MAADAQGALASIRVLDEQNRIPIRALVCVANQVNYSWGLKIREFPICQFSHPVSAAAGRRAGARLCRVTASRQHDGPPQLGTSFFTAAIKEVADTRGYEQFAADYSPWPTMAVLAPPFVVTVAFPLLVIALYATAPAARGLFALLALAFAGVYTAVLGAAYWLQITNVPWNVVRGADDGIAPWVVWNPASFFWSLETFAYFAMGAACALLAFAFEPGVLPRGARRGLFAMGWLGVWFLSTALKDVVFNTEAAWATAWSLSAFVAWVLLFGYVALSLARWFATQAAEPAPAAEKESLWQPV